MGKATAIGEVVGAKFKVFWHYTERLVRQWEQRPLARRKKEVLTIMTLLALVILSKALFDVQRLSRLSKPSLAKKEVLIPKFRAGIGKPLIADSLIKGMYSQHSFHLKRSKTKTEPGSH
jgi:hypothetical protein